MAKAALNMLTFTAAPDYAEAGIFMNAVDTGWVTDEDPLHHAERKQRDARRTVFFCHSDQFVSQSHIPIAQPDKITF